VQGSPVKTKIPILKHDWPQHERPIASDIAQQSAVFFRDIHSITLSFPQGKIRLMFKKCYIVFSFFFI
jgi:hypothetical protein